MDYVTFSLKLLFLAFILTQSDADFDQCCGIQNEISRVEGHVLKILTELECRNETLSLKQQLVAKNNILKTNKETQKQLQTTIDVLAKEHEVNSRTIQVLGEKEKQLRATIDGQTKTVEALNQSVEIMCGQTAYACRYLIGAAFSGDINTVKMLVNCTHASCTTNDWYRKTPLIVAAANGQVEASRVLLENGADIESTEDNRRTALHYAAIEGQLEMCRLLLDFGAKVDSLDDHEESPLHLAARLGYLSVVILLVERGADVRLKNNEDLTASEKARSRGHSDVADWLDSSLKKQLEATDDVLKTKNETLEQLQSTINGEKKTEKAENLTVEMMCGQPKDACRYLSEAAESGNIISVKILVNCTDASCTTDDYYNNTPLIIAAANGHLEVVRALLEGDADVEMVNTFQRTALHYAAWEGNLDMCRLLLEWGAQVNPLDKWKESPLHDAAYKGHLSVVKLLQERGTDVKLKNGDGQTAGEMARSEGHSDVADWLDSLSSA